MPWLNYHHLLYFWTVAKTASVAEAARDLSLSPSAVSAQVKQLEKAFGRTLLAREGHRLVPTEIGSVVFRFADEIFRLGEEMAAVVREGPAARRIRLEVGIVDDFPPLVTERLLSPATVAVPGLRLSCRRGALKPLLADLAAHDLDVVLSSEQAPDRIRGKAHDHLLGECGVTFFASERLLGLRDAFPNSLDRAPALLPLPPSPLRGALDAWFRTRGVTPAVVGEFNDQAVLRAFAAHGLGFFAGASVVEEEIRHTVGVAPIGKADDVRLRFYAITVDQRLRHPGVAAVVDGARGRLFG